MIVYLRGLPLQIFPVFTLHLDPNVFSLKLFLVLSKKAVNHQQPKLLQETQKNLAEALGCLMIHWGESSLRGKTFLAALTHGRFGRKQEYEHVYDVFFISVAGWLRVLLEALKT